MLSLKALIVLYAYADLPGSSLDTDSSSPYNIPLWPIKSLVEAYALRLSLHRSVQGLKSDMLSSTGNILESSNFQKYLYWLWLFTSAH
jgi:hypothetical protein